MTLLVKYVKQLVYRRIKELKKRIKVTNYIIKLNNDQNNYLDI